MEYNKLNNLLVNILTMNLKRILIDYLKIYNLSLEINYYIACDKHLSFVP